MPKNVQVNKHHYKHMFTLCEDLCTVLNLSYNSELATMRYLAVLDQPVQIDHYFNCVADLVRTSKDFDNLYAKQKLILYALILNFHYSRLFPNDTYVDSSYGIAIDMFEFHRAISTIASQESKIKTLVSDPIIVEYNSIMFTITRNRSYLKELRKISQKNIMGEKGRIARINIDMWQTLGVLGI